MKTLFAVSNDAGVPDRDEREEALGASKDAPQVPDGVVRVALLKGQDQLRVEQIMAGLTRDGRDAGEELGVEGDARRLQAEVIAASDGGGRLYPRDSLGCCHVPCPVISVSLPSLPRCQARRVAARGLGPRGFVLLKPPSAVDALRRPR